MGLVELYEKERLRIAETADGRGDYSHPVFGEGPVNPLVMLIGEAPGGDEAKQGRPFVGKAGKQLDALLSGAGIDRSRVYITNTVKFRPVNVKPKSVSNRTPTGAELKAGLPLLKSELCLLSPRIIVTLGNTPLKAVLTLAGERIRTVGELHGRSISVTIEGKGMLLSPQYHPASVIYNRALADTLAEDIGRLGEIIRAEEER